MDKKTVSVIRYEKPLASVRRAVELCRGLDALPRQGKVFIKPNIVFWSTAPFPKWGVITTSRVVEDMIVLLKERGINDIAIGEGIVFRRQNDEATPADAFEKLGFNTLKKKYGVKAYNIHQRDFVEKDLGGGVVLNFNRDILESDFVVDLPVLKTHSQTIVSLGIKNLKGTIDVESRKKCHNPDLEKDLDYMVSKLANSMPPILTVIDGLYSLERGPGFDGNARRSNLLIASADPLSADMVGAKILGHDPDRVPHLVHAARDRGRPLDMSDIEVMGEAVADVSAFHDPFFAFNNDQTLPLPLEQKGVTGLSYPKYDSTLCTYCSGVSWIILNSIYRSWKDEPWDDVEVLSGKRMRPSGKKKTILMGKCMCDLNQDHPAIKELIMVKGCPPPPQLIIKAFKKAGIDLESDLLSDIDRAPGIFMRRYKDKPEFDESFYQVN